MEKCDTWSLAGMSVVSRGVFSTSSWDEFLTTFLVIQSLVIYQSITTNRKDHSANSTTYLFRTHANLCIKLCLLCLGGASRFLPLNTSLVRKRPWFVMKNSMTIIQCCRCLHGAQSIRVELARQRSETHTTYRRCQWRYSVKSSQYLSGTTLPALCWNNSRLTTAVVFPTFTRDCVLFTVEASIKTSWCMSRWVSEWVSGWVVHLSSHSTQHITRYYRDKCLSAYNYTATDNWAHDIYINQK